MTKLDIFEYMFSSATNLKVIRCELNQSYAGKIVSINDWKKMQYTVGVKGIDNYLILKYRINFLDKKTNEEVFGYLGEKHLKLAITTVEKDKPTLMNVLNGIISNSEIYISQNSPASISLANNYQLDVNKTADEIFLYLQAGGFYS